MGHRNGETQDPIHDEAGNAPPRAAVAQGVGGLHQLPERCSPNFQETHHDLYRALSDAGVIVGEAVGHGGYTEARISGGEGFDVGVAAEAAMSVVGEEDGDVEVGEAEELRQFQHRVDVALHR